MWYLSSCYIDRPRLQRPTRRRYSAFTTALIDWTESKILAFCYSPSALGAQFSMILLLRFDLKPRCYHRQNFQQIKYLPVVQVNNIFYFRLVIWESKREKPFALPGSLALLYELRQYGDLKFTSCRSLGNAKVPWYLSLPLVRKVPYSDTRTLQKAQDRLQFKYKRLSLSTLYSYNHIKIHLPYSFFSPLLIQLLHLCFFCKYLTSITHTSLFKPVLGSLTPKLHGSKQTQ